MDYKILISDVDSRKGMDIVNCIQRHYQYPCILTTAKKSTSRLGLIFGQKVHQLRHASFEEFQSDIEHIVAEYNDYQLVYIPVSEVMTRHFILYVQSPSAFQQFRYLLPNLEAFNCAADKKKFQTYCELHQLPVPRSYQVDTWSNLHNDFRPFLIKPKSGQGSVGIKYVSSKEDLNLHESVDFETNIVQERIITNKQVTGAFFLVAQGQVVAHYCHQRIRTFPQIGGVTIFSKSVYEPEILKIGEQLLHSMNWNGLAMIEFLFDDLSQEWKIIELNPRTWGSILLSAYNESDLLKGYIEHALAPKTLWTKFEYKQNVAIRWIYPFDFLALLKRQIRWNDFVQNKNVCFINFTYSSVFRSVLYLLYFTFNFSSLNRFAKKLMTK